MEPPPPMPSKDSIKLKISTNHADGTSKIVSNRPPMPPPLKSNHSPGKTKDCSQSAGSRPKDGGGGGSGSHHRDGSKHKHEHDGVSSKEHRPSSSSKDPNRSSSEKHKSSSSSSSSSSKPKISSSSPGSSSKPKEGSSSSSSKPKDGKPTSNGEHAGHGKSSSSSSGDKHKSSNHSISNSSSGSKPSSNSVKPKDGSQSKSSHGSSSKDGSGSHHKSSSGSSSSSKPKDGSGDRKSSSSSSFKSPKEGSVNNNSVGSSNSLKPKSSSGSGSGSDHHKSSSSSSGSKPKETSSSSSKDGVHKSSSSSSSSRPVDKKPSSSSGEKKSSSSSSTPKVKDENRNKENHDSHSSHKEKPKDGVISKSHDDRSKSEVKVKTESKDKEHGSGSKSKTNSSSSSSKTKTEPNGKVSSHESKSLKVKPEPMSDEEIPLADKKLNSSPAIKREIKAEKRPAYDEDSEDEPLLTKLAKKPKKEVKRPAQTKRKSYAESSDEDEPVSKKMKKATVKSKDSKSGGAKYTSAQPTASPVKKGKKTATEEPEVWKWWEEEKQSDGSKWKSLEHKGPVLAPDYEPVPKSVKFYYNGKHVELSQDAEEVATFYAKMLDHEYTTKDVFNNNFMKDWRQSMTSSERELITDLKKCDFKKMHSYFTQKNEERKSMTKEQKQVIKQQNEEMMKEYGFCIIDGHKEKIGNFKIEPPGLFRGRGEHPKMGRLKKRTIPEDVIINCSKGSKVPEPPKGHKWKEVRHDNTVSWLASWSENVQGNTKYVMLNPSSKLKGEKDWQKYETARKLKTKVNKIREEYQEDWRSKEMRLRQRAVALYFIDKLALRAGNEKDSDETADTVGCCSLRVEHIKLHDKKDGKENVVDFDFLGKDSIRYFNSVTVEKRVYKNLQLFMQGKQPHDDLFDRLNTTILNKYLNDLMEGLTAKVFRTYNASKTLQEQLDELTNPKDSVAAKLLSYNRANRAVAILCNHQRAVPKTFDKSMENMNAKITAKKDQIKEAKKDLKDSKGNRSAHEKKSKALERLKEQLDKLEMQATDKEENKQIALGTSKLNYLDPRISVAWCKKWEVPIERIFNRTQRDKFRWAIDMAGPDYVF